MSAAPRRPCAESGCAAIVVSGRCPAHQRARWRQQDAGRARPNRRGYGDAAWLRVRRVILAAQPVCPCGAPSREVDHIIPVAVRPDLRLELSNLRAFCKPCHSRRTMRDQVR